MTRRRKLLAAAGAALVVVAAVVGILLSRSSHRTSPDCDTVRALIEDNSQFRDRMRASAGQKDSDPASAEEYRQWAERMTGYADKISQPDLADRAKIAADRAHRLADLVPRYRAKPDDPATARDYAGIGIEFGNAISRMEYACLDAG
jgi:hypothetical protein